MNNHNCHFIGATGLYPIQEIITNTSNNLINYNILTSNNLISYTITTSNNLIDYTDTTSNNIISYTNTTSNNITSHYNNLLNTTLPTNNISTSKETIIGNNYIWNETILEPLNHLSSIYQVQDNTLPEQLDADLSRYYYFHNNELKEAVSKTTLSSYTSTSYYNEYKKWFGYVGGDSGISYTGGIEMIANDTTQSTVNNATINLSIMLGGLDVSYSFSNPYNAYCVFNIKWNGKNTARILFCGREITGPDGYGIVQRFVRVQYIQRNDIASTTWRNNASEPSSDDYIIPLEYNDGYNSYHYWSFNLQRDRWYIYLDGNLVLTSSIYSTNNFNFGITDLKLEDAHLNLNDVNRNRYQFSDVYYFKRHLTANEIQSLSRYHMSQLNNTLRVYSTIECDKIICNSILDYDYTENKYKPLTFNIQQTSNLQYELDHKEPLLNLTPDRVIISDPNSTRGALTTTSITSNEVEDIKKAIIAYNPIINFLATEFTDEITQFIQANPNLITIGVSASSTGAGMLASGSAIISTRKMIPKAFIEDFQTSGGDLRIFYPNLFNSDGGRVYITETFRDNNVLFRKDTLQGFTDNIKNINTGSVKIGSVDGYETNCKFQVIGGDTKIADKLIVQKSSSLNNAYIYNTTSRLELQSGIYNDIDNDNCSITATGLNHAYNNNLSIRADGLIDLQTYDTTSASFTPKITILNNGNIGIGGSTNITNKLQVNGTIQSTDCKITSLTPNTVLVVDNDKKIVSSALISKDDLDTLGQSFIDTSNYVDYTCNIIMTDVNQKFVDTSNYTLDTSNVISNRITGLAVANINGLQDALDVKQASVSASATSIITITNSTLNTLIEQKETKKIYYDGNFEITSNFYCSNLSCKDLKTEGKTVLSNPNAVDEYATINPYFNRLTKNVVFQIDNTGNKVAKDLISSTTYDYNKDYIDYALNVYAGHIQNGVGQLYFYDKYIETYPLDTESFSVSFWFYVPNGMPQPDPLYRYMCEPLRIDQQRFNFLFQDRRRLRLLISRGNYAGNIGIIPEIILQANFATNDLPENFLTICEGNLINFTTNYSNPLFITFNAWIDTTNIYGNIYVNGVLVGNGQRAKPNTEWRLEKFYFYQYNYTSSSAFLLPYQNFRFWDIYMTYNTIMSGNEAIALYRFETNQILNTLEVNGTIKASAVNTDTIYIKNKIFTLPSSFNNVSLFAQEQQTGKITTQTPSASVRNLSIDNVIVNSTGNLINNSGNAGFLYYTDNQNTTVANCKSLAISDVANLQDTLDGKASTSHNHDTTYAFINHNHDSIYAPIGHNHDNTYAPIGHNHDTTYATINHNHDSTYAPIGHNHDSTYAPIGHNHDSTYAPIGHNHDSTYAPIGHNHDSTYAPIGHNHDTTYASINHNHAIANINGLSQEFINTSNYVLNTSNAISNRITNLSISSAWSTTGDNFTTGNVGIGTNTASTTYDLDIQNATTARLRILGTGTQGDAILALRETSDLYGFDVSYIGNTANKFYIRSYTNSATAVDRLSIDRDNGQVGIGTGTASRLLHLHTNATASQTLIQFTDNTTTASGSRGCLIGKQTNNDMLLYNYQNGGDIIFGTAPTTTGTIVSQMIIDTSGRIGIGGNPSGTYRLEVAGSINLTTGNTYRINGSIVQADWSQTSTSSQEFIKNKPIIPTQFWVAGTNGIFYNTGDVGVRSGSSLFGTLTIGNADTAVIQDNEGTICICRKTGTTGRIMRLGYNSTFDFVIGDFGTFGTQSWRQQVIIANQAPANSLVINSSGRFGIGTNTLNAQLHVVSTLTDIALFQHTNLTQGIAIGFNSIVARGSNTDQDINIIARGASGNLFFQTNAATRMTITGGGRVGIGTTNPSSILHITDFLIIDRDVTSFGPPTTGNPLFAGGGTRIVLYPGTASVPPYSIGIEGGTMWFCSAANFRWYSQTTEVMRFITNSTDRYLQILTSTYDGGAGQSARIFNTSGSSGTITSQALDVCLVCDAGAWIRGNLYASSDNRIKKDIQDIDDGEALQKILMIKPKKYKYIDNIYKDTSNYVYGFEAQQIREVLPDAVSLKSSVIPNIYSICENTSNGIYYENTSNIQFSSNLDIDIISLDGKKKTYKIQDYSDNYIKLNENIENSSNVFIYGTHIDDFHTLNKDYIFALCVCATQELHRIIQEQNERITRLENIISEYIENKNIK